MTIIIDESVKMAASTGYYLLVADKITAKSNNNDIVIIIKNVRSRIYAFFTADDLLYLYMIRIKQSFKKWKN